MKQWKIGAITCLIMACLCACLVGCDSQTYTPTSKEQTVSAAALGKSDTLRVGVNASSAPLAGQTSSSSRIVGIDVDVAAYLADQMGLKVEVIDVGNDPSSALSNGTVDIVLGVDASETEADYWRSGSYISTGVALFSAADETAIPAVDSSPKIAAQASSKSSWRVTNLFGDDSLVTQSDLKSAFETISKGEARYVAADAVIGTYVSYSNDYNDKVIALLQDPSGYCAAVSSNNTELQSALSAAMDKLVNGGMMSIIETKWLGSSMDLANMTIIKSGAAADGAAQNADAEVEDEASGEGDESVGDEVEYDGVEGDEGENY